MQVAPLLATKCATPLGSLTLITDEQVVLAAGFSSLEELRTKLADADGSREIKRSKSLSWLTDLVVDYFEGDIDAFNSLKVRQPGNEFSQSAWRAMRKIRSGTVISYATLAKRAGSPSAVRAAGTACGRNAIAPIIPCHRIIRTDGTLGNYGYGLSKKRWLLRHEGAID